MSFGSTNNPPWQRNSMGNAGQSMPNLQNQMSMGNSNMVGYPSGQPMYNQNNMNMNQPQTNMSMMPSMSGNNMGGNQMFNQPVAYPQQTRGNMSSIQQMGSGNNNQQNNQGSQGQQTCNKIGVVTKIQNDYGFIDEEVFFHKNSCKGTLPKVGDRVLVEATYSTNSAFKWSATCVQLAMSSNNQNRNQPSQQQSSQSHNTQRSGGSGYNAVPPPNAYAGGNFDRGGQSHRGSMRNSSPQPPPPPLLSTSARRPSPDTSRHSTSSRNHRESRFRDADDDDRKRRHEDRDKEKDRAKERRDRSLERRDHSPVRRSSPKRNRRNRVVPRYMVQIPKISLIMLDADLLELRRRYANLYIPSDFFNTQICWPQSFPSHAQFSLRKPCSFHIMHRSVEMVKPIDAVLDPPDADYIFSAKVMLMGIPPMTEVYRKCFSTAEEKEIEEDRSYVHPTRLINFLIGLRGKNEPMAIGGPWSESLDGPNPDSDPSVLIRTAIRTCKALTGIDLSPCTQWYRFVELYYRRSDSVRKGRTIPARVETVVIYLPDIRSCIATRIEWDDLILSYKKKMDEVIKLSEMENNGLITTQASAAPTTEKGGNANNDSETGGTAVSTDGNDGNTVTSSGGNGGVCASSGSGGVSAKETSTATNDKAEAVGGVVKREPKHYSELDPRTMKIADLRDELEARNLSSKGLKPQLIARLSKVLKTEETDANATDQDNSENEQQEDSNAANDDGDIDMTDIVVIDEYDSTKPEIKERPKEDTAKPMDERERRLFEKRYQLPDNPELIVHPSRTAKSGKFFCNVMSLSILLDYRPEDSKEHSFEVALFAELFNEMLMRDFGFNIYKALYMLPEPVIAVTVASNVDKEKDTEKSPSGTPSKNSDGKEKTEGHDGKDDTKNTTPNDTSVSKDDTTGENKDNNKQNTNDTDKDRIEKKSSSHKEREQRDRERDRSDRNDRKRRKEDETDDDSHSIKSSDLKKKEKERPKTVTVDPELLLSFVYFDQTHCGYIFEKDIEDLFHTLGLGLSRSQIRKLMTKAVTRDSLFYRKLTDKPKDEKLDLLKSDDMKEKALEVNMVEVGKGNKIYLPVFRKHAAPEPTNIERPPTKRQRHEENLENGMELSEEMQSGMITFKGCIIDIDKLLDQMKRSERARDETEQLLVDLRKTNSDLLSSNTRAKEKINYLLSDVKSYSRKLKDTEDSLSSINRKCSDYYSTLSSIFDRVQPHFPSKSDRVSSRSDKEREKREQRDQQQIRDEHRDRDNREKDNISIGASGSSGNNSNKEESKELNIKSDDEKNDTVNEEKDHKDKEENVNDEKDKDEKIKEEK